MGPRTTSTRIFGCAFRYAAITCGASRSLAVGVMPMDSRSIWLTESFSACRAFSEMAAARWAYLSSSAPAAVGLSSRLPLTKI